MFFYLEYDITRGDRDKSNQVNKYLNNSIQLERL